MPFKAKRSRSALDAPRTGSKDRLSKYAAAIFRAAEEVFRHEMVFARVRTPLIVGRRYSRCDAGGSHKLHSAQWGARRLLVSTIP